MIDIDIQTIEGLTDDLPGSSDPMYQVAALSLMIRKNFEAMESGGLSIQKPEITDLTAYNTSLTSWLDDALAREAEIIKTGTSEIVANLPDILSIGAAYLSGGASAAIGMLVKVMLARVMGDSHAEGYRHTGGGTSDDFSDIVDALEAIDGKLATLALEAETFQANFASFGLDGDVSHLIDGIVAIREVLSTFNLNVFREEDSQTYSFGPLPEE